MNRPHRLLLVLAVVGSWATGVAAGAGVAAPSYSVTLLANPTTLETTQYTTLTTTSNRDLTGTAYTTYLFDQSDPTWYQRCKVASCSFQVTQFAAGAHTYIAYVARDKPNPRYPPMQVKATSSPVTVTWTTSTFTITLEADRTWAPPGSTIILTATTNKDVAATAVDIQIFDLTDQRRLVECTSGTTCLTSVTQLTPTTHTYQAFVAEPLPNPPPPNVQASSSPVSVTWSPLPDPSRPPNVGGGPVTGSVHFSAPGVPPIGALCAQTSFRFDGMSESAWINGSGTAYVGALTLLGTGGSSCESASTGDGLLVISASGTNGLRRLDCGPLEGRYTRVATDVTVVISGDCVINGFPVFRVSFVTKGEFRPTNDGGGVTNPVTDATFVGAFAVGPG